MKHYNVRDRLLEGTIQVIATQGLDKATTKAISKKTGLFETYIYQYFSNKDLLLAEAFKKLDEELLAVLERSSETLATADMDIKEKSMAYFLAIWEFMLGKKERCLAYIRYYCSPYFGKYSSEGHIQRYAEITQKLSSVLREEADKWMLLNYILSTTMMFATKVIDGSLIDNENAREHVFNVIYSAVSTYFK